LEAALCTAVLGLLVLPQLLLPQLLLLQLLQLLRLLLQLLVQLLLLLQVLGWHGDRGLLCWERCVLYWCQKLERVGGERWHCSRVVLWCLQVLPPWGWEVDVDPGWWEVLVG
jgi:hypothetical protein